jgi:hypothetical protein
MSLGVFDGSGEFHGVPEGEELPWGVLEELFRARTLLMLEKRGKIDGDRVEMLRTWRHSGFHVSAERRIGEGDRKGLESLLEYMERSPVSEERLEVRVDGLVVYRGNYHPGLGTDHRLVTGLEFLAMMVPHVLTCSSYYTSSGTREHASGFWGVPPWAVAAFGVAGGS